MLGVRRAGVTVGLQHFKAKGLISTGRGAVTILDRDGLMECANGLYAARRRSSSDFSAVAYLPDRLHDKRCAARAVPCPTRR